MSQLLTSIVLDSRVSIKKAAMVNVSSPLSWNDAILFTSLLYWVLDLQEDLHELSSCRWPVQRWLLISYVFVVGSRLINIVGTRVTPKDSGDFLVSLRHKDWLPRVLAYATWLVMLPSFVAWTLLGSFWIADSKWQSRECLPPGLLLLFVVTWNVLCCIWILLHVLAGLVAANLEKRLQHAEADLRQIEDDDMRSRWGGACQLPGYLALSSNSSAALTPAEINRMDVKFVNAEEADKECSICLEGFTYGDRQRELAACGHTFHSSCIDLWLLRCAHCPLCKRDVRTLNEKSDYV